MKKNFLYNKIKIKRTKNSLVSFYNRTVRLFVYNFLRKKKNNNKILFIQVYKSKRSK